MREISEAHIWSRYLIGLQDISVPEKRIAINKLIFSEEQLYYKVVS